MLIKNAFDAKVFGVANLAHAFLAPKLLAMHSVGWKPGVDPVGIRKDTAASYLLFPGQAVYGTATEFASTHFLRHLQVKLNRMPTGWCDSQGGYLVLSSG